MSITTQVPVPEQLLPVHPVNEDPFVGAALSVTVVPTVKVPVQEAAQLLMPPGELVTVPLPVPAVVTVSVAVLGGGLKPADTVCGPFITTTHGPVPLHPAVQPANVEPPVALALRVTELPAGKFALHVLPQLIPAGLLVIVPLPVSFTDSSTSGMGEDGWFDGVVEGLSEPAQAANTVRNVQVISPRLNIVMPLSRLIMAT